MDQSSVWPRIIAASTLSITAALGSVQAQTVQASVAVQLEQHPDLQRHVLAADVDGDGRADLIGGAGSGATPPVDLRLALGRGDGTFVTPVSLGIAAEPSAIGDLDGDGRPDLVARTARGVVVLPNRGGGTFGAPVLVHAEDWTAHDEVIRFQFALVADFDGLGHADLAVPTYAPGTSSLLIFPGRGDFTFDPPATLPLSSPAVGAVAGDFTGDGRPDLAVTQFCCALPIFLNQGGLLFTLVNVPTQEDSSGIAAGDLDGDGRLDLVVAEYFDWNLPSEGPGDTRGHVAVLLGQGDGTFRDGGRYDSGVRGETAVAISDFTHDGVSNVATGNRSYVRDNDLGIQSWDSVSIFPGDGTGRLAPPATFALDTHGSLYQPSAYAASLHRLAAADLTGDGRADLVSSPGVVLITRSAAQNRPPVVTLGRDRAAYAGTTIVLDARAIDPDGDWLRYEWTDAAGHVIGWTPLIVPFGAGGLEPGQHTFTVRVDDGRGGTGEATVTVVGVDAGLRTGWSHQDVGSTAVPGSAAFDGARFTIAASGADIWGHADAFHFLHHPIRGDFRIVARTLSVEQVHVWTKAGLMIRESLAPGARHASIFATPTTARPVAFQRRTTAGGASVHTAGASTGTPVWLALTRAGDRITAHYRAADGDQWIAIGTETLPNLSPDLFVGLAVTSHRDGTLAHATFDRVALELPAGGETGEDQGTGADDPGSGSLAGPAAHTPSPGRVRSRDAGTRGWHRR